MANKELTTLLVRSLTGAVFVGIIIFALLFSSYASFVVLGIAMYVCLGEFISMVSKGRLPQSSVWLMKISALLLYGGVYLFASGNLVISPMLYIMPLLVIVAIFSLFDKKGDSFLSVSVFASSVLYVVFPFSISNIMINNGADFNGVYLLAVFLLIWVNDSFAYLFGVSFGKHRLWERISPKKSWEGFIGGGLSTVILSSVLAHFFFPEHASHILGVSFIVVLFGTFGDLFESKLKRQFDVKDSGSSLPGHGGFLDRFDSFIFIVPFAMLYLEIVSL